MILMLIQNLVKLCIRRNGVHSEDGAEIVVLNIIMKLSVILKQGGILQVEDREYTATTIQ
jgi:hypothetical protein